MSVDKMDNKKGGLFGKPAPDKTSAESLTRREAGNVSSLNTRMRILEERLFNIQKKLHVRDENMLETNKEFSAEIKEFNKGLSELKTTVAALKEELRNLVDELDSKASESEFMVYKKYLELWRPVNFVTQGDVERLVEKALAKQKEL